MLGLRAAWHTRQTWRWKGQSHGGQLGSSLSLNWEAHVSVASLEPEWVWFSEQCLPSPQQLHPATLPRPPSATLCASSEGPEVSPALAVWILSSRADLQEGPTEVALGRQPLGESSFVASSQENNGLKRGGSTKGNQPSIFIGRTDAEAETSTLWPHDAKSQLTGKDAGKDWRQKEKGTTEDEMVGWHHRLKGHEFEQTLGDSEGEGSLACCSAWDRKESDTTERLNNNNKAGRVHWKHLKPIYGEETQRRGPQGWARK